MKSLADYKENIHSCSKCGLCQSVCPIYKITGNDCTVSRGQFIMLKHFLNGELKMSKVINKYLDICLKCSACSRFCPSGIDVVDIISLAKAEYFKTHKLEHLKSFFLKFMLNTINNIGCLLPKKQSKKFEKKVIYFAGCSDKGINAGSSVVKILNSLGVEVIIPNFNCCGYPFFINGDMATFEEYMNKFYSILQEYENYEVITNCATCEKVLNSYAKWGEHKSIIIKNVFDYIKDNNLASKFELKKAKTVTFHKPCNMENYETVKQILENTTNLNYIEMKDFDKCCGFNSLTNSKNRKLFEKLYKEKYNYIENSGAKIVLTSCTACKITLKLFSRCKYKVYDLLEFLSKNIV